MKIKNWKWNDILNELVTDGIPERTPKGIVRHLMAIGNDTLRIEDPEMVFSVRSDRHGSDGGATIDEIVVGKEVIYAKTDIGCHQVDYFINRNNFDECVSDD